MTMLYALAPTLIVIGPAMLATCLLALRVAADCSARTALLRLSRVAATITVLGVLPMAMLVVQGGGLPESFQNALADHTFSQMGSTILR